MAKGKGMGKQTPDNYMKGAKTTSVKADGPTNTSVNTSVAADSNRKWGSGEVK